MGCSDNLYCDCKLEELHRVLDELNLHMNKNDSATISNGNRDKLNELVDLTYATRTRLKQRLYS